MTYPEVVDWLFEKLPNYQQQGGSAYSPGLDRITNILSKIGDPHKKIKTIHIAGTNGKGSVSHILAAIFQNHGYKTGLFTSPHITDLRERVKINGDEVSKDFVIDFCEKNKETFEDEAPSFFELTTAMAFEAFYSYNCDIAIIETGLGGRLDSTNVIIPELSVITNISIDHTAFLGSTAEEIAEEKAGIIKPNIPVVIGDMEPSLRNVFEEVAHACNAKITFSSDLSAIEYKSDLLGGFQQRNIWTVITAINCLKDRWSLKDKVVKDALCKVYPLTNFKGRLQQIEESPRVVLDAAHNKKGLISLLDEVKNFDYKQLRIIYGVSNDKDWKGIIENFPNDAIYYFSEFDSNRSVKGEEFDFFLKNKSLNYKNFKNVKNALTQCKSEANSNDLILVCGSFYLLEKII